ncbi:site-specific integrase [Sulfuricurvum sp. IAE1]|uniref:site-specific integrase n=1 Tax=Sulfuricurvum sp. IAE1 TaxID=2546102 RepID=UPI00104EE3A9|nr:site-specific integrase [Sulfuricurvum sp. IAE1]TDA63327.1 site-specific integrase [Sulfuricurvum sp. IAE1]
MALNGTVHFYTPTTIPTEDSFEIQTEKLKEENDICIYYGRDGISPDDPDYGLGISKFHNFPFVVNEDGSLWKDATLYLIWKIKHREEITPKRLQQIADYLQDFLRFCEMTENNEEAAAEQDGREIPEARRFHYLNAPIKSRRPNVMYGQYLLKIKAKQWGPKMKAVSGFYQYLIEVRKISFPVDMLERSMSSKIIATANGGGYIMEIGYNRVDQEAKTQNQDDGHIRDGEKMRPMSIAEQIIFEKAMLKFTHEELVLGSMIAITSMARKQTVYTLRLKHFISNLPAGYDPMTLRHWRQNNLSKIDLKGTHDIHVGDGTGADTKNGKRMKITIDNWLRLVIIEYIISPRAVKYRNYALSQNSDLDQYLFLTYDKKTMESTPYYHANDDINLPNWLDQGKPKKTGNGIDQAMKRFRDGPLAQECTDRQLFPVRFHDLRASGAMRFIDRNESFVDGGETTWSAVLIKLSKLMGHDSIATTQMYLDFKQHYEQKLPQLQFEFEEYRYAEIQKRILRDRVSK